MQEREKSVLLCVTGRPTHPQARRDVLKLTDDLSIILSNKFQLRYRLLRKPPEEQRYDKTHIREHKREEISQRVPVCHMQVSENSVFALVLTKNGES